MADVNERVKTFFRRISWSRISGVNAPLWHRLERVEKERAADSVRSGYDRLRVVALCGYSFSVNRWLSADGLGYSEFMWKEEVKTRKLRCSKCDAKLEKRTEAAMGAEMVS